MRQNRPKGDFGGLPPCEFLGRRLLQWTRKELLLDTKPAGALNLDFSASRIGKWVFVTCHPSIQATVFCYGSPDRPNTLPEDIAGIESELDSRSEGGWYSVKSEAPNKNIQRSLHGGWHWHGQEEQQVPCQRLIELVMSCAQLNLCRPIAEWVSSTTHGSRRFYLSDY